MLAVAAAVMMLACSATVWLARGRAELITVGQISAAVSWIAAGDSSRSILQPGDQVRGGTSASTGGRFGGVDFSRRNDDRRQRRYRVGTSQSAGKATLTAAWRDQRYVRTQPASRPMLIRTPTARI